MSKHDKQTTYGPYSPCQQAGNLVFTAGQVGAEAGKAAVGITDQTKLALKNLGNVLADAGASFETIVKTTVYLTDMADFEAMNQAYAEFFSSTGCSPARATVGVQALPPVADRPLLIEIEAVAVKDPA